MQCKSRLNRGKKIHIFSAFMSLCGAMNFRIDDLFVIVMHNGNNNCIPLLLFICLHKIGERNHSKSSTVLYSERFESSRSLNFFFRTSN